MAIKDNIVSSALVAGLGAGIGAASGALIGVLLMTGLTLIAGLLSRNLSIPIYNAVTSVGAASALAGGMAGAAGAFMIVFRRRP